MADPDFQIRGVGGGGGHPGPEIRERAGLQKNFFRPLGPQFVFKIRCRDRLTFAQENAVVPNGCTWISQNNVLASPFTCIVFPCLTLVTLRSLTDFLAQYFTVLQERKNPKNCSVRAYQKISPFSI